MKPTRRDILSGLAAGTGALVVSSLSACRQTGSANRIEEKADERPEERAEKKPDRQSQEGFPDSTFGEWQWYEGRPEFVYRADPSRDIEARFDPRHFHMLGNRALQMQASNDGTVGLFDESEGHRWLVSADRHRGGSGWSRIVEPSGETWGSAFFEGSVKPRSQRSFGPTYFRIESEHEGLRLERTLLLPEGEVPWVLVRVHLALAATARTGRHVVHDEVWHPRPQFLSLWQSREVRQQQVAAVRFDVTEAPGRLTAIEDLSRAPAAFGNPAELVLEGLGETRATPRTVYGPAKNRPELVLTTPIELSPGEEVELYFRFGRRRPGPANNESQSWNNSDPRRSWRQSMAALDQRLPRAHAATARQLEHEVPWHAAALTGGSSVDLILGGHTLSQGSAYSFEAGSSAAARDSLQHALPLVYIEPDLALSVLRNVCAWGSPDGDLPFALAPDKQPITDLLRPSDQNLWALWLAAEFAIATGDLASFEEPVPFHPIYDAEPVALVEHLVRMTRFLLDEVGVGSLGHVRILNADWNDNAIEMSGVPRESMIESGSSVLNSAMAAWVFSVFAPVLRRLDREPLAAELELRSNELRALVAASWNGRWFHRAYTPAGDPVGDERCWLEVQPWAILCGAAEKEQAGELLATIDRLHRKESPLGARLLWPATTGEGTVGGGVWYAISMTLSWAAAKIDPSLAADELRRMTLASHTEAYPAIWEGTLSGPDCWNAPESQRPGRTWIASFMAMQSFPVANLHSHAQPLLTYLRLLGVEPTSAGQLRLGPSSLEGTATFDSQFLHIDERGHGRLQARGPVRLDTASGIVESGPGEVRF